MAAPTGPRGNRPAPRGVIVVEDSELQWSFRVEGPKIRVGGGHGRHVELCPTPCYRHDPELVRRQFEDVERRFPCERRPGVYVVGFDSPQRTNGETYETDAYPERDELGRTMEDSSIILYGKPIPLHPAMTRYLVAHEYGHAVERELAFRLIREKDTGGWKLIEQLREKYAELRGLPKEPPPFYGPRTWHQQVCEIFANDFRVLIAQQEPEFWPHHDISRPEKVEAVVQWWVQQANVAMEIGRALTRAAPVPA